MPGPDSIRDARSTIEAVWRIESARLIASLVRMLRDVDLAEELAQDALVAALERWPRDGVPDNPGAWLMTTAKHAGIDRLRRHTLQREREAEIARVLEEAPGEAFEQSQASLDEDIGDDLLRLMFIACHPILAPEAQVALTLRLLGGLSTPEIARAFLTPEPTIAQRIVRAKRLLAESPVAFEAPRRAEIPERIDAVLAVLYLVFNEGYSASAGDDWLRPQLCEDAMRLGRVLLALAPRHSEAHGLQALMELQASRFRARTGADGQPVRLAEQDRSRWDRLLIGRGLGLANRAWQLSATPGPYALQAAIAGCHAQAASAEATDWPRIVFLYEALGRVAGSPIVTLNRAVAVGMAYGAELALPMLEALAGEPALRSYYLLPAARADMLERLGRNDEAAAAWNHAATLAGTTREREWLLARAALVSGGMPTSS